MNLEVIQQSKHVFIEQQDDWLECFGVQILCCPCCERSNKYVLWQCQDEFFQVKQKQLGDFNEESSCCCRCMCFGKRSFSGQLQIGGVQISTVEVPYKFRIDNPIQNNCITCCCMKPEMKVTFNSVYIGKVVQPYYGCCWGTRNKVCCPIMELQIFNQADDLVYTISGKCCQKPVCCIPLQCCGGCGIIKYELRDASNGHAGTISNLYRGCFAECCTRQDNFGVTFDNVPDPKHRLLIIKAALWLDYLQYHA